MVTENAFSPILLLKIPQVTTDKHAICRLVSFRPDLTTDASSTGLALGPSGLHLGFATNIALVMDSMGLMRCKALATTAKELAAASASHETLLAHFSQR